MNTFFLIDDIYANKITGFELGDIIFEKGNEKLSSTGRKPNQSMMLFITVPMLLMELMTMIESSKSEVLVEAVDSSYAFRIFLDKKLYCISDERNRIINIEQKELLISIYHAANSLWNQYGQYIMSKSVRDDFCDSLKKYNELIKHYLKD